MTNEEGLPGRTAHRDRGLREAGDAHRDRHAARPAVGIGMQGEVLEPGPREHLDRGAIDQPSVVQEHPHAPDAVAAHLGDGAVGVRVVHEERRIVGVGAHHPDHAVGADPRAAIAQGCDRRRVERTLVVQVDEHHEIVAGTLVLGELEVLAHAPSRYERIATTASVAPPSPASNHRTRGSRRNHAI
jgi:hypothetical protein